MEGYAMVMPFVDGSESYTLGFEAGQVWQRLTAGDFPERQLVHAANLKQLEMMAKHFDCDMFVDATSEGEWNEVTFTTRPKQRLQLVPNAQ